MSYILKSSLETREINHKEEIKKIQYTITELEALHEKKINERKTIYDDSFYAIIESLKYPFEYYKMRLHYNSITNELEEIKKFLEIEQEKLKKEYEYLRRIYEDKEIPSAIGADVTIF